MILKSEDFKNWDKLIQHCETLEGLTDLEKENAKRAFQTLREELGEGFLEDAFNMGHPLCQYFINLAPWTRRWIIWFARALRELKNWENYSDLELIAKFSKRLGKKRTKRTP